MNHPITPSTLLCCLLATSVAACAGEIETESPLSSGSGDGSLLATVSVDEATHVTFWELGDGVPAIRETTDMDLAYDAERGTRGKSRLPDLDIEAIGLVGAYEILAPGKPVPEELVLADERAAARRAELPDSTAEPMSEAGDAEAADDGAVEKTADYYGDNYGAQWFLNLYCTAAPFRWCLDNRTWFSSGWQRTRTFKTCVMAADFEARVRFRGEEYTNIRWGSNGSVSYAVHKLWDFEVQPRYIECWTVGRTGYFESYGDGLAPSPRLHFAVLRWL